MLVSGLGIAIHKPDNRLYELRMIGEKSGKRREEGRMADRIVTMADEGKATEAELKFRFPIWLALIGLILGLSVEVLFYGHLLGISFFIWAFLCVAGLLGATIMEGIKSARGSLPLALPILFFSFMVCVRLEPLTMFLNIVLTLALLAIWVRSFRHDRLIDYGWLDLAVAVILVPLEAWIRPWRVLGDAQRQVFRGSGKKEVALAILRGIILAVPILAILMILLSAADLVFEKSLEEALKWLDLERLADLTWRAAIIIISGLFLLGAVVLALRDPGRRTLIGQEKPLVKPFLGFIESVVVLGGVDLLFAIFVGIQFAYLFGGQANINSLGYSYSEYARKGFGELVAVGVLSLLIIFGLASWSERKKRNEKRWFLGLSSLLVAEVLVILISAMKRLMLYEKAYGFTRLRTYTHVFTIWMGVLLLAFLIFLFINQLRRFAPAFALGVMGFALTLNLLNVDAFIVRQNITHLEKTSDLDIAYLAGLTEDAVPPLVALASESSFEERDDLLGELACWQAQLDYRMGELQWPSTHFGRLSASRSLEKIQESFDPFQIIRPDNDYAAWSYVYKGEERDCQHQTFWGSGID
jgi:hypothetical protein